MSVSEGGRTSNGKRPVVVFIIPLIIGLLGYHRVTQSPQFESIAPWTSSTSLGPALASALRPRV